MEVLIKGKEGGAHHIHIMIEAISTLASANLTRSPAWQASFSIDGKYLAVCFGNPNTHVKIWQCCKTQTSNNVNTKTPGAVEDEEWKLIATIQDDAGHTRSIRSVAFAPTSISYGVVPILATASFDGKVLIWEYCHDDEEDDDIGNKDDMMQEKDHDNYTIANNEQSTSSYFEPIAQLEGHDNEIKDLAWNATGSLLASCGRDKTIWIWECFLPGTIGGVESSNMEGGDDDGEAFECLAVLQGHDGDVKSIAFGPSHNQWGEGEEILVSASYDNTIKVWAEEAGDWYCAMTLGEDSHVPQSISSSSGRIVHTSTVWCVGVAPGGVRFFSGSDDGSMAIWKLYTATERKKLFPNEQVVSSTDGLWKCVGRLPDAHSSYAVFSIDCAPTRAGHGRIASAGGDNSINIYREESLSGSGGGASDAPKFSLEDVAVDAHDGDVNCIKWHPRDGRCLVSCGDDGAVKLWRYIR